MSSRVLRKLQGEKELISNDDDNDDEDHFEFVPVKSNKKKKPAVNPFDLLKENDSVSEDGADEVDDIDGNSQPPTEEAKPRSASPAAKKKKKKKKKNKGKDGQDEEKSGNKIEEDIDATIREVNDMLGITTTASTTCNTSSIDAGLGSLDTKALLGVEHRNLNAESEMKRRFGSNIVRGEQRQRKTHRRVYHRSTWLVSPKDTWPNMSKSGLSMSLLESKNGYNTFAFEHSQTYQNIQFQFLDAVESLDPNNISTILHSNPFHVDSLLQLSEVCKMGEDYQMAAELIERSLYCFECSFHTLFSLAQGTSRLDYRRPENRPFFIALFRQLHYVGQRGCHRTSLELCKLLLSLDPDNDPLCVLLMIDFYAITSEQYSFLVRLYDEWESHRNLSQLPSFAYSVALAQFHLNKQTGDKSKADSMIQNALIMFPSVLVPLTDKCNVVLDPSLAKHRFFSPLNTAIEPMALKQLVALYVGRSYHVWKDSEVLDWLVTNAKTVTQRVDNKEPLVEECARKRRVRYQGTPRNIYRHIIMSDIKDATASLPMELSDIPMMSYDPLPPVDSISSYARPERHTAVGDSSNPLTMFFRSLLPSFNPQAPTDPLAARQEVVYEAPVGAEGGPRPLQGGDLVHGVENLMTAMRELLNTMSYHGEPANEQPDEEEQDWNEEDEADRPN